MKICFFSDIHGNLSLLRKALPRIKNEAADTYIFLGDLCGYFFEETECLEELLELPNLKSILGNHDEIFLKALQGDTAPVKEYTARFGPALTRALEKDCSQLLQFLEGLTTSFDLNERLSCFHGSPWDPLGSYIYPDSSLDDFCKLPQSIFLLGQTHHPMDRTTRKMQRVVNPGSIGQPRHGGLPSFAVIDLATDKVKFHEFEK